MEIAERVEQEFLEMQNPMNAVIDRGDSVIQQCYKNSVVLITGATGFLGKQLLEKLVRSCDIKKIYLLIRLKKDMTLQERVIVMLQEPVFEKIYEKKPDFESKLIPIDGNISEIHLGICPEDWITLTEEVNVIFHLAATTRFDEELNRATLINVRGTREAIEFGKACKNLRSFVHVSTAFTHATRSRINKDVLEQFYPSPISPEDLIKFAEDNDEFGVREKIPELMSDWPNTYVFTKAVAEELVRLSSGDLPISIFRPPVVTCSICEPTPGWLDKSNAMGPSGVILGIGLGVIHVLLNKDIVLCSAPVDVIANAMIAVSWDTITRWNNGDKTPEIFTASNYKMGVTTTEAGKHMRTEIFENLSTPKALWYTYTIETDKWFVYWALTWILHYIPAYLVDGVLKLLRIQIKGIPSVIKIYEKIYKMTSLYSYFLLNEWAIRDYNLMELMNKLTKEDRAIFNFDVSNINQLKLLDITCVGLRKFIVKDGLKDTEYARKKQQYFKFANMLFLMVYVYFIWKLCTLLYFTVSYLLSIFV